MALTPEFDLWSPDDGDDWDLTVDMAAMMNSVESALEPAAREYSWSGSPMIGSGRVAARRFGRLVMVAWNIASANIIATGHVQFATLPALYRPARITNQSGERATGTTWFAGTRYGDVSVYSGGGMHMMNRGSSTENSAAGSIVFLAD